MNVDEIFQALKQAYGSKYGVADDYFRGLAESILATGLVTKENLATVVQGQDKVLRAVQSGNDKVATEIAKLKAEKAELEKKVKVEPPKTEDVGSTPKGGLSMEDVNTAIAEALAPVTKSISDMNTVVAAKARSEQIAAKVKEYGIPDSFAKRFKIPDDANLDEYFKEVKQDFTNIGFEGTKAPETGSGDPAAQESAAISALIDKGTKEIKENQTNR